MECKTPPKRKQSSFPCSLSGSPSQKVARTLIARSKQYLTSPKYATSPKKRTRTDWTKKEDSALVQFIALHGDLAGTSETLEQDKWPSTKNALYWEQASKFIREASSSGRYRAGVSIRSRVVNHHRKKFNSINDAEEYYGLGVDAYLGGSDYTSPHLTPRAKRPLMLKSPTNLLDRIDILTDSQFLETLEIRLATMSQAAKKSVVDRVLKNSGQDTSTLIHALFESVDGRENLLNELFAFTAKSNGILSNLDKYVTNSIEAMKALQQKGKSNLIYKWPQSINRKNSKGESVLSFDRMPFGLLQYQIEFFSASNSMSVHESPDYNMWLDTMEADFGGRVMTLFRGPMWSGQPRENWKDPEYARVNVACTSKRQHLNKQSQLGFSTEPGLQEKALDQLKAAYPKGRFWLKTDGTDIKECLLESQRGEWNGDIDLHDGSLRRKRELYEHRSKQCDTLMKENKDLTQQQLQEIIEDIANDLEERDKFFLTEGLKNAKQQYQTKFNIPTTPNEVLKTLSWETVEFRVLLEKCQELKAALTDICLLPCQLSNSKKHVTNAKLCLKKMFADFKLYLRNLFKKMRQPAATHVLVFMLSDERRNKKPYTIPVMYTPFHSLNDAYVRDLSRIIKLGMKSRGMELVGTTTDGEFCSLRTQGETRMLHVWQAIHDAKESVGRMSKKTLLEMLLLINVNPDGSPVVVRPNPAIPNETIVEIATLQLNGMSQIDAITHVRSNLVPSGYTPHPFRSNTPESLLDKLRSIVGTMIYRCTLNYWESENVYFKTHLYVPEVDPITLQVRHDRGDHNHILKRIATATREGKNAELDVEKFDEAMLDSNTGFTHGALIGLRKQSVGDAERLLSFQVANFLKSKGYEKEGEYVQVIAEWHEASDGRGLTQLERCRANYKMLNFILDKWMPWHNRTYDFSTIDINRPIDGIQGFTRETVIEITANIESQEARRLLNKSLGYEEHPRAGSTDDVEAMFSISHHYLGNSFTLEDWKYKWKKIVREMCKKMDPTLPYYIWTQNERFRDHEEEYESFDKKPATYGDSDEQQSRLRQLTINKREDSSIFTAGRAFLPIRNKPSIRRRLHQPQAVVPPVPDSLKQM